MSAVVFIAGLALCLKYFYEFSWIQAGAYAFLCSFAVASVALAVWAIIAIVMLYFSR